MVGWWRAYNRLVDAAPLRASVASSAVLWCAGDVTAQHIERRGTAPIGALSYDWRRTAVQTVYASLVWAPMAHYWYEKLDALVLSVARAGSRRFVAAKLAAEMVALHPVSLVAFFSCVGLAAGEPVGKVAAQLRRDFAPTLALEWLMWAPLDVANFALVPVRHQLLLVNCGCFTESVVLSLIKANGFGLPGHGEPSSGDEVCRSDEAARRRNERPL